MCSGVDKVFLKKLSGDEFLFRWIYLDIEGCCHNDDVCYT